MINWGSIALVFIVALVAVVVIVSFYSLGLRLLAVGSPTDSERNADEPTSRQVRPPLVTLAAYACIAVGIVAVLYGIYLVIPQFH